MKHFTLYIRCMNKQILNASKLTSLKDRLPSNDQIIENILLNKRLKEIDGVHQFTPLELKLDEITLNSFYKECRIKSKHNPIAAIFIDSECKLPIINILKQV